MPLIREVHDAIVPPFFLVCKTSKAVSRLGVPCMHELGLDASGEGRSCPDSVHVVGQQAV